MPVFVRKDPHVGYYGRELWLPKAHVNVRSVKAGLEFPIMEDNELRYLQLWQDRGDHLVVPREFFSRDEYQDLPFPVVSLLPDRFPQVRIISKIKLDKKKPHKTTQRVAFDAMLSAHGGLLNLGCGKGKTVLALHYIAKFSCPALVVVNNTTLIDQWRDRINEFLDVEGGVGVIQGPPSTWDWQGRGICLAMIHSLALRANEIPIGMDRYFGIVIYDEVHHLSAPLFVRTAPMFYGERHGLTATVRREDGLEPIYQYHIGDTYHRDLEQDLIPEFYFQQCPVRVDWNDPEVIHAITDKNGKPNIGKLRTYLGTLPECNDFIAEKLRRPLEAGRKMLVLSHSVDQLRLLHEMFDESGLCTGREKPEARLRVVRTKQLTFGTTQLVREALDEESLDFLYFLTPFGSNAVEEGGFNTLQQGMGRTQRDQPGKKTPKVFFLDHIYVPQFHRMCSKLKQQLRNWPADQGGPFDYKLVRPYSKGDERGRQEAADRKEKVRPRRRLREGRASRALGRR
jgi:superfamily II DNA or RNA helicase